MDLTWDQLHAHLETLRRDVAAEIGAYPTPITGCDAQFNHLTDRRRQLTQDIARLDDARAQPGLSATEFAETCDLLGEIRLRSLL